MSEGESSRRWSLLWWAVSLLVLMGLGLLLRDRSGPQGDLTVDVDVIEADRLGDEEGSAVLLTPAADAGRSGRSGVGQEDDERAIEVIAGAGSQAIEHGCIDVAAEGLLADVNDMAVSVSRFASSPTRRRKNVRGEKLQETRLDQGGTASFCGLGVASYMVDLEDREKRRYSRLTGVGSEKGARAVLEFGGSSVVGFVLDESRRPCEGAQLTFRLTSGSIQSLDVWSAADGTYAATRLLGGEYSVEVRLPGSSQDEPDYQATIRVGSGETLDRAFEPALGTGVMSGVVLGKVGSPVVGTGLRTGKLTFQNLESQALFRENVEPDGTFRIRVPSGRYKVAFVPPGHRKPIPVSSEITIDEIGLEQDLTVPGVRVEGVVLEADGKTWRPADRKRQSSTVRAYRKDREWEALLVSVRESGIYSIDGLDSGTWIFSVGEDPIEAGVELQISEGDMNLRLDLSRKL